MQSGTRLLFHTCDKTIITILNFKISGGRGGGGGAGIPHFPRPVWNPGKRWSSLVRLDTLEVRDSLAW